MDPARCGLTLAEVERGYILDTLKCCHGNRTRAARLLNISLRGLRIKLHDYAEDGCSVCGSPDKADDLAALCEQAKSPLAPCRQH